MKLLQNMIIIWLVLTPSLLWAQENKPIAVEKSGQMSWWADAAKVQDDWRQGLGMRYIPHLTLTYDLGAETFIDGDLALNTFVNIADPEAIQPHDLRIYRAHVRLATAQTETRIGFQKINFGPARLLRPLRWFDQINPNDPLQLTEGVYALRYRYHALSNANLWLWALYGNEDLKGNEILPTVDEEPELGGRFQFPFVEGDAAFSLHTRRVEGRGLDSKDFTENRIAFDGQWDIGVGIWFESVFQYQDREDVFPKWDKMLAIGGDYTFDCGNGLYFLLEHLMVDLASDLFDWDGAGQITALYMNYPINTIDSVAATFYYDWQNSTWLRFVNWQRQYDHWRMHMIGFWNSDQFVVNQSQNENTLFTGQGIQLLIVFNH